MTDSKNYDIASFEGDGFVQECLKAFDASIAQIEKEEHDTTTKSA